jgi:hypothetical protein
MEFAEGMPHYTKDGVLYEGPTHRDADGRLMTGETHTEDSEYLYHEGEFAEIGPRGGIKASPKAPPAKGPNKTQKELALLEVKQPTVVVLKFLKRQKLVYKRSLMTLTKDIKTN